MNFRNYIGKVFICAQRLAGLQRQVRYSQVSACQLVSSIGASPIKDLSARLGSSCFPKSLIYTGAPLRTFSNAQSTQGTGGVAPQSKHSGPAPQSFSEREATAESGRWFPELGPPVPAVEKELFSAKLNSGIHFESYDSIPIEVHGSGAEKIQFVNQFSELQLHPIMNNVINLLDYKKPTPVQKSALPIVLGGHDLMACAQTGSGKTAAYIMPILQRLYKFGIPHNQGNKSRFTQQLQCPSVLILSPTRELANQIYKECRKFTYRSNVRSCVVYGGANIYTQLDEISRGCQVLVATPGRLMDIFNRFGAISLKNIEYCVLDEADRMLDMGFEPQVRNIVQNLDMPSIGKRQMLMFSATFPNEVQKLAASFLKPNYIFLTVGRVGATSNTIRQRIVWMDEQQKLPALQEILSKCDPSKGALVFTQTKRGANYLETTLMRDRFPAVAIHGDKTQTQREYCLEQFKTLKRPILVATEVAARGLDIPNVAHVINYDMPNTIDDYVHRIGRTGRLGNEGEATSFFNLSNSSIASDLVTLLEESKQDVPQFLRDAAASGVKSSPIFRPRAASGYSFSRFGSRDFRRSDNTQRQLEWQSLNDSRHPGRSGRDGA